VNKTADTAMIKAAGNMTSAGGAATKSAGSAMNNTAGNMISVRNNKMTNATD
jgi:hypothetical protein